MTTPLHAGPPRPEYGSFDFDSFKQEAQCARAAYLRELASNTMSSLPALPPGARRALSLSAVALALATAAFWVVMLISPPQTKASGIESAAAAPAVLDRCEIGSEVSNFVCRNTWMAHHAYSYR